MALSVYLSMYLLVLKIELHYVSGTAGDSSGAKSY